MEFIITAYNEISKTHTLKNTENGDMFWSVDLLIDGTFYQMDNAYSKADTAEKQLEVDKSLIGKTIIADKLMPLVYSACNVKFTNPELINH